MKKGHYTGSDIKPLSSKERKAIDKGKLSVAAKKHQAGLGSASKQK